MTDITQTDTIPPLVLNGNSAADRDLLMSLRKSYLEAVDALERRLGIVPRTAEIRAQVRANRRCAEDKANGRHTD